MLDPEITPDIGISRKKVLPELQDSFSGYTQIFVREHNASFPQNSKELSPELQGIIIPELRGSIPITPVRILPEIYRNYPRISGKFLPRT